MGGGVGGSAEPVAGPAGAVVDASGARQLHRIFQNLNILMQGSDSTRMIRMIILNIRQNILAGLVD